MKRTNILISILIVMLLIISGCGPKTVTSREEIKKMADEFYNDLLNEKNVTMSSYANDELISITTIDNDKGYSYPLLADYDFYVFEENGKTKIKAYGVGEYEYDNKSGEMNVEWEDDDDDNGPATIEFLDEDTILVHGSDGEDRKMFRVK